MKTTVAIRNAELDTKLANLNNGYLRFYSGTKPASADAALSGNTLLAELRFAATAFGAASGGSATANAITQDSSADAAGTATFARCFASNGTTPVLDLTVGTSGTEIVLGSVSFSVGLVVQVTSATVSQPDGA
jgi:hypothetical protein